MQDSSYLSGGEGRRDFDALISAIIQGNERGGGTERAIKLGFHAKNS